MRCALSSEVIPRSKRGLTVSRSILEPLATAWTTTSVSDRIVFDKLVQVLVLGAAYEKIADSACSATTILRRRDERIQRGLFALLEQICLNSYDKMIGLELEELAADGCIVKASCGGEAAGQSRSSACSQARTTTARPCLPRLWIDWAGSGSSCRSGSLCTWTPATTAARPAPSGTSSAATK